MKLLLSQAVTATRVPADGHEPTYHLKNIISFDFIYGFDRLQSIITSFFHWFWWLVGDAVFTYAGPLKINMQDTHQMWLGKKLTIVTLPDSNISNDSHNSLIKALWTIARVPHLGFLFVCVCSLSICQTCILLSLFMMRVILDIIILWMIVFVLIKNSSY